MHLRWFFGRLSPPVKLGLGMISSEFDFQLDNCTVIVQKILLVQPGAIITTSLGNSLMGEQMLPLIGDRTLSKWLEGTVSGFMER